MNLDINTSPGATSQTETSNSKSLTIAFHANGDTAGGLAAFIRQLAQSFREMGHKIILFVNRPGPFSEEMEQLGNVYSFDMRTIYGATFRAGPVRLPDPFVATKNLLTSFSNRKKIVRIICQAKPDVVVGNALYSAASIRDACAHADIPLILCVHGIGKRSNDLLSLRSRFAARLLNQADAVVGVSKTCLERYQPFLKSPTSTIYNCCPPVKTDNLKVGFLAEHNLSPDTLLIGGYGRIQHDKGHHVLLSAFSMLKSDQKKAILIGGSPLTPEEENYFDELKSLASNLGIEERCIFLGHTAPEYFFSIADIFCHTYLGEENLSYAILESMSASCPVIAVGLGGPTEMIDHPHSGQLVPPDDPAALAEAISLYLNDPDYAQNAAELSLKRIQTQFNFGNWAPNWLELIYTVLKSR